ncbi:hypothetical protein Desde_3162 [Desulfitobacterium dehalogenans ATCC 51507]|uniref:Uncharacterized protein n=1 Tax=Desulfitobacterium dehalogenans (strain ATCC 51507 / DSM 9161 / JW/IU-DC1) TaxID=756499 RepID=I4ABW8_DESDJ|nr:hypothetical protein [Desulfitobacterium dehalogenans]AFM01453.1 hypothetical protein Desde_3162 [Desulfitobacterium dehalogenans ATCC 51507]
MGATITVSGGFGASVSGATNENGYFNFEVTPTIVGGPYTLHYSVTSSSGTYTVSQNTLTVTLVPVQHVLEGVTILGKTGTMPNMAIRNPNGVGTGRSQALEYWTGGGSTVFLKPQKGFYDGDDTWTYYNDSNLNSGNIRAGTSIFGVNGNPNVVNTSGGNLVPGGILSGYKGYSNGSLVTGTIPSKSAATITPSSVNQTITAGQYLSGTQTIQGDPDLISSNIRAGVNIFGVNGDTNVVNTSTGNLVPGAMLSGYKGFSNGYLVTGTIPSKSAATITPSTVNQTIASGQYLSGTQTILGDPNLIPSNIISGKSIFGVVGTAKTNTGVKYASGSKMSELDNGYQRLNISGLSFRPSFVLVQVNNYGYLLGMSNYTIYHGPYNTGYSNTGVSTGYSATSDGFSIIVSPGISSPQTCSWRAWE